MSDFAQHGQISTLQQLNERPLPEIETRLAAFASSAPITLVLPCHAADLQQPALRHIVDELAGAAFIREIIVAVNGPGGVTPAAARQLFDRLPQSHRILRASDKRVERALARCGIAVPSGKGLNVWLACGVVCAEQRSATIVTQDCDVLSFRRADLARLCFAAAHPEMRYTFCKMFYSRAVGRLYGRITRIFLAPLLQALVRVIGKHPLVEFLRSFRYPLAGECAISTGLVDRLAIEPGWGLEIGILCELFRREEPHHIAQVESTGPYEHRHQPLGDEQTGLVAVCKDIARTCFAHLVDEGIPVCRQFVDALRASFAREMSESLRRSRHLALINDLQHEDEAQTGAAFLRAFAEETEAFLTAVPRALLPSWAELRATRTRAVDQLLDLLHAEAR